jgi:hypothetical protein
MNNDFIEQRIIKAVRGLLTGRVNEILREMELNIPAIELGDYEGGDAVVPVVLLNSCESTEKERLLRWDAYNVSIFFQIAEASDSELYCYAYSFAICKALIENPALDGVAEDVGVKSKTYGQPKRKGCGEGWKMTLNLRVMVDGRAV